MKRFSSAQKIGMAAGGTVMLYGLFMMWLSRRYGSVPDSVEIGGLILWFAALVVGWKYAGRANK
jgi:hypothetical protein